MLLRHTLSHHNELSMARYTGVTLLATLARKTPFMLMGERPNNSLETTIFIEFTATRS